MNKSTKPNAAAVFDGMKKRFRLKNDAALARLLSVSQPMISAMRSGNLTFGIAIQEKIIKADFPKATLKRLMAAPKA